MSGFFSRRAFGSVSRSYQTWVRIYARISEREVPSGHQSMPDTLRTTYLTELAVLSEASQLVARNWKERAMQLSMLVRTLEIQSRLKRASNDTFETASICLDFTKNLLVSEEAGQRSYLPNGLGNIAAVERIESRSA